MFNKNDLVRGIHRRFDVIPGIRVDADAMRWPSRAELARPGLSGNREYFDLSGASRRRAREVLRLEDEALLHLEERQGRIDEREWEPLAKRFYGEARDLDMGVAAATFAISATGGIPVSSCNGGAIGPGHMEDLPVVAFFWPKRRLDRLKQAVTVGGLSLWNHRHGELVLGADYIRRFPNFAEVLLDA